MKLNILSHHKLLVVNLHSVLFGFWNILASHLERPALKRSYGYASAADRPTCFASLPQNSKSWREMRARCLIH